MKALGLTTSGGLRDIAGTALELPRVASLPSGAKGEALVLDGDGHLYVHDGTAWVDCGASGGGGGGLSEYAVRQRALYL